MTRREMILASLGLLVVPATAVAVEAPVLVDSGWKYELAPDGVCWMTRRLECSVPAWWKESGDPTFPRVDLTPPPGYLIVDNTFRVSRDGRFGCQTLIAKECHLSQPIAAGT